MSHYRVGPIAVCLAYLCSSGSIVHAQSGPEVIGQWSPVQPLSQEAIHMMVLPTGKVMLFDLFQSNTPQLWDPVTNTNTPSAPLSYLLFCAGHSQLADGRMLMTGGHIADLVGEPKASIYNPFTDTWTRLPDMNAGRWYPTNTTLPNGEVVVVAGNIDHTLGGNTLPQVWQPSTGTWRNLTGAQYLLPMYPRLFALSDGRVFNAGPQQATGYLNFSGTGSWVLLGYANYIDRDYGSAVMYDEDKILIAGGGDPPTETAEVINLKAANPTWRYVAPMANKRRQLNLTLLPDGKVLSTGGSSGPGRDNNSSPVFATELWDPVSETWTNLAPITVFRGYHSGALLLPDGRVLSAGGDFAGATAEIYSPPYLFKGPRPTITTVPATVGYGSSFFVETPDSANIGSVTFLRPGAATHAFNQDQRINKLTFTPVSGGIQVTSPASANVCPPGYYMLFILNQQGVPSVARMVRIGAGLGAPPPTAPSGLTATVNGSAINLAWVDNSNNEDGFRIERAPDATNFAQIASVGPNIATFSDTTGTAGTTYTYRVRAYTASGNSAYSDTASATLPGASVTAPSGLTATINGSAINLAWVDNSDNEDGFRIERAPDATNFAQIASVGPNIAAFSDTTGAAGTTYTYRVRAYKASGNSTYSNTASATLPGSSIPAAPTNLSGKAISTSRIDLSWTDNATNETGYKVEGSGNGTTFIEVVVLGQNATTYSITGLTPGKLYTFRVRAYNSAGNSAYSNTINVRTLR